MAVEERTFNEPKYDLFSSEPAKRFFWLQQSRSKIEKGAKTPNSKRFRTRSMFSVLQVPTLKATCKVLDGDRFGGLN